MRGLSNGDVRGADVNMEVLQTIKKKNHSGTELLPDRQRLDAGAAGEKAAA